jgi:DsbC/DsbD-like thiol-disulfide interchange protein
LITVVYGVTRGAAQPQESRTSAQTEPGFKPSVVWATTPHLTVRTTSSDTEVTPGARISLAVEITPKAGIHVYAPGGKYRPVAVRMQPQPFVRAHEMVYPRARTHFYQPLNEHALVYSEPFRLVQDLTVGEAADPSARRQTPSRLTLKGALEYQACDDSVCYLPTSVPLQWTVRIKR